MLTEQVDIEMAFASGNTVMKRIEILIDRMYSKFSKKALYNVEFPSLPPIEIQKLNFPRMNYQEAMLRHGSDKPDLRIKGLVSVSYTLYEALPDKDRSMITAL